MEVDEDQSSDVEVVEVGDNTVAEKSEQATKKRPSDGEYLQSTRCRTVRREGGNRIQLQRVDIRRVPKVIRHSGSEHSCDLSDTPDLRA